ncbi:MAG: cysteine hydrolase [bacterium]|nr:cysteine hydrolase [bacterium]
MRRDFTEDEVLSLGKEMYEHGQARFEVEKDRCALLVIDMQNEFVSPQLTPFWVPGATRRVPRIRKVIQRCREVSVPVIYTVFTDTHHFLDRPRAGQFMPNRLPDIESGHNDWFQNSKVWPELEPLKDEIVIKKPSYGAFYNTPLQTILHNLGRDTVIIAGTMTNYCCGATARQAYERGFNVVFGSDITATDDPQMQENELRVLRRGFALVLSAREISDRLN